MGIVLQMSQQLIASYLELNIVLTVAEGQALLVGAYLLGHGSWKAWTLCA